MKSVKIASVLCAVALAFTSISANAQRGGHDRGDRRDHGRNDDRRDHGRPGYGRPDHRRPDHGRPDHGRPGYGRPDHGRPGYRPGQGYNPGPGYGRPGQWLYAGQVPAPAHGNPQQWLGIPYCGTEAPQFCNQYQFGATCYTMNGYWWDTVRGQNWFNTYQCR